jgi:hypothetical protein
LFRGISTVATGVLHLSGRDANAKVGCRIPPNEGRVRFAPNFGGGNGCLQREVGREAAVSGQKTEVKSDQGQDFQQEEKPNDGKQNGPERVDEGKSGKEESLGGKDGQAPPSPLDDSSPWIAAAEEEGQGMCGFVDWIGFPAHQKKQIPPSLPEVCLDERPIVVVFGLSSSPPLTDAEANCQYMRGKSPPHKICWLLLGWS